MNHLVLKTQNQCITPDVPTGVAIKAPQVCRLAVPGACKRLAFGEKIVFLSNGWWGNVIQVGESGTVVQVCPRLGGVKSGLVGLVGIAVAWDGVGSLSHCSQLGASGWPSRPGKLALPGSGRTHWVGFSGGNCLQCLSADVGQT